MALREERKKVSANTTRLIIPTPDALVLLSCHPNTSRDDQARNLDNEINIRVTELATETYGCDR
jgi:hypothetical protein